MPDKIKNISLRVPRLLWDFVALFIECYEKKQGVRLKKHEAILTLIRRGLMASSEMPEADK